MKNKIYIFIAVSTALLISAYFAVVYKNNVERSNTVLNTYRATFCNRLYNVNSTSSESEKALIKISNAINFNYNSDNFPKPGSGDVIYKDMSDVSQNIRYSHRPYITSESFCKIIEKNRENLTIRQESSGKDLNYYSLGNTKISLDYSKDYISVDLNPDDNSGFGGFIILKEK